MLKSTKRTYRLSPHGLLLPVNVYVHPPVGVDRVGVVVVVAEGGDEAVHEHAHGGVDQVQVND